MRLEVTTMILRHPPLAPAARPAHAGWRVRERRIEASAFLALYRTIGESVQWDDRLRMAQAELAAHLAAPTTRVFLLEKDGAADGFCEFERCGGAAATLEHPPTRLKDLVDERMLQPHEFGAISDRPDESVRSESALANFGVVPALRGTGLGRVLLHAALAAVWRPGGVVRLDTDTNDDPRALGVYKDAGFVVERVAWKTFPD